MKTSREALLDVAFRLFPERGNDTVSMNDLVAASGVSKGAFHCYFPIRTEDLVQQLIGLQEGLVTELGRPGLDSVAYWRFIRNLPTDSCSPRPTPACWPPG